MYQNHYKHFYTPHSGNVSRRDIPWDIPYSEQFIVLQLFILAVDMAFDSLSFLDTTKSSTKGDKLGDCVAFGKSFPEAIQNTDYLIFL